MAAPYALRASQVLRTVFSMSASERVVETARVGVRSVLLVDDQETFLKYTGRDFAREGIAVTIATSRDSALDACIRQRPDLAIVDLFLEPPDNGVEIIERIKRIDPSIFCILVSAHMSVAHALMGVRAGADDVFLKPFRAAQALQRALGEPASHPELAIPTLDQIEWEHISRVLQDYDGNITHAAEALGVYRQSLQRKIRRLAPRALYVEEPFDATRRRRAAKRPHAEARASDRPAPARRRRKLRSES